MNEDYRFDHRVHRIASEVVKLKLPPREQDDAVRAACGGDAALVAAVQSQVKHFDQFPDGGPFWPTFPGYEILGRLGSGGEGVVYKARELDGGEIVALKTLHPSMTGDPKALARLSDQFQLMYDLYHPNLVTLHSFHAPAGQSPFLVMDFVEGRDFMEAIRPGYDPKEAEPSNLTPEQLSRLRRLMGQLFAGLAALHQYDLVHGDLKPSNVRVKEDGTVVILDFGVVRGDGSELTTLLGAGTLPYMSPQQADRCPTCPECDFYAAGVMLYAALTGKMPFHGPENEILRRKREEEVDPPHSLVPTVPSDLDDLCARLLRRRPEDRPKAAELLRFFPEVSVPPARQPGLLPGQLVGRTAHLKRLEEALKNVRRGESIAVLVDGGPGEGKSTLVSYFLNELADGRQALVLEGRCFQAASFDFKAVYGVLRSLRRHLNGLPRTQADAILPTRGLTALANVFPLTLGRADSVRRVLEGPSARPAEQPPDQGEQRRRAFWALRDLFHRLGDRCQRDGRALIVFIDDIQWGDIDSTVLLTALLQGPEPPGLMFVCCYRRGAPKHSHSLRQLIDALRDKHSSFLRLVRIRVDALGQADAEELAVRLLRAGGGVRERSDDDLVRLAQLLARRSQGNLYFLDLLAREWPAPAADAPEPTPDQVLLGLVNRLSPEARRLLNAVVLFRRPLPVADACRAAGLIGEESRRAVTALRRAKLALVTHWETHAEIEPYHGLIGKILVRHMDPAEKQELHRRLAEALTATDNARIPVLVARHYLAAGDQPAAAREYLRVAEHIHDVAFDRAARYYRKALKLGLPPEASEAQVREQLAETLANQGRSAEAAEEYLRAATSCNAFNGIELRQRAAMQLLSSGLLDEGLEQFRLVVSAAGLSFPDTPGAARRSFLFRQLYLWFYLKLWRWLRGGRFFPFKKPDDVGEERLREIDVCWTALGLSVIDPVLGFSFQTRSLLLALRAGEPYRIARALAAQATHLAALGRSEREVRGVLDESESLAARVRETPETYSQRDAQHAAGTVILGRGISAYLYGRWTDALLACDKAEEVFRLHCTAVTWELDTARVFALWSMTYLGDLRKLGARWSQQLKQAKERGDLYAETNLGSYIMALVQLGRGRPRKARRMLRRTQERWPWRGHHVQHHNCVLARVLIDLYESRAEDTCVYLDERWQDYGRAYLFLTRQVRIEMHFLRGTAANAAAVGGRSRSATAERDARALEAEELPHAKALGLLLRADLAAAERNKSEAIFLLRKALVGLDHAGMALHAETTRYRLGQLLGGTDGRELEKRALEWMKSQHVHDVRRLASLFVPAAGRLADNP